MREHWDVIIVGARCAGATLAALLAQRGVRTLVVEASSRGSNMPMSTHLVQPPGMAVLDELGLGGRVRAVTPATARFRYALDDASVTLRFDEQRAPYCVRRSTLDPWLQDTAEQAGAELCFRHRVVELLREGDRVTGVVVNSPSGTRTLHADLVVGADGAQSTIAKLTGVEEYLVTRGSRAGYWAYYDAPSRWDADWDSTLEHQGNDLRYVFRCDGNRFIAVYVGAREVVHAWGKDRRAHLTEALSASPTTRALTQGKQPVGPLMGLLDTRFFYRRPVGPGFALVGDAGHFEDFVTGQGMTDAFLGATRLATAIVDGREEAFAHYWRLRDVETLPVHFDATRQGAVGFNEPFMRTVIAGVSRRPALVERLKAVFDRKLGPAEMLPTSTMLGLVAGALLRGRFQVAPGFLRMGKQLGEEARVLAERKSLLATSRAALERAAPRVTNNGPRLDERAA